MEGLESSRQSTEPIYEESESLFQNRWRCCSFFPCFNRSGRTSASPPTSAGFSLWSRGVSALMKIREWSEIVAGPRWKTFIRRFNRNRSGSSRSHVNCHYDPLSYAMNFDEGPGQNGDLDDEGEDYYGSRNFSSRYAKGSMDLGKDGDGPTFV